MSSFSDSTIGYLLLSLLLSLLLLETHCLMDGWMDGWFDTVRVLGTVRVSFLHTGMLVTIVMRRETL